MEITLTNAEFESDEDVNLTRDEMKIFIQEIAEMILKDKSVDVGKAIHNARYLAEIGRRLKNVDEGKNLIKFANLEELKKYTYEHRI